MPRPSNDFNKPTGSRYVFVPKRKLNTTPRRSVTPETDADSTFDTSVRRNLNRNILCAPMSSEDHTLSDAKLEAQDSDTILSNIQFEPPTPVKLSNQLSKILIKHENQPPVLTLESTMCESLDLSALPEDCFLPEGDINQRARQHVTIRRPVMVKKELSLASTVKTGSFNIDEILAASAAEHEGERTPVRTSRVLSQSEKPADDVVVPESDNEDEADQSEQREPEEIDETDHEQEHNEGDEQQRPSRRRRREDSVSPKTINVNVNLDINLEIRNASRRRSRNAGSPNNDNQKKRPKIYVVICP